MRNFALFVVGFVSAVFCVTLVPESVVRPPIVAAENAPEIEGILAGAERSGEFSRIVVPAEYDLRFLAAWGSDASAVASFAHSFREQSGAGLTLRQREVVRHEILPRYKAIAYRHWQSLGADRFMPAVKADIARFAPEVAGMLIAASGSETTDL
jgi:hypothetical protein